MKLLIKNGRVIDPSRRIDAYLNLLIEDGKIRSLTQEAPEADRVIDAGGLTVCPGFVDMHAHEDPVTDGVRYADEKMQTWPVCCVWALPPAWRATAETTFAIPLNFWI